MFAYKGSHGDGLEDSGDQSGKLHGRCNLWFDAEGRKSKGEGWEGGERVGWSSLRVAMVCLIQEKDCRGTGSCRCQDNRLRAPVFNNVSR
jgi:hypothetical protein